jgi:hypothetical protein
MPIPPPKSLTKAELKADLCPIKGYQEGVIRCQHGVSVLDQCFFCRKAFEEWLMDYSPDTRW